MTRFEQAEASQELASYRSGISHITCILAERDSKSARSGKGLQWEKGEALGLTRSGAFVN